MATRTITLNPQAIEASVQRLKGAFAKAKVSGVEAMAAADGAVLLKMRVSKLNEYKFASDQRSFSWKTLSTRIVLPSVDFIVKQRTENNFFLLELRYQGNDLKSAGSKPATNRIREIFAQRSLRAIEVLKLLDERHLAKAVEASTDNNVLLYVLNTEEALASSHFDDPLARARDRGFQIKRELLEAEGGTFSSLQVASVLGISRQAVDKRRNEGKLFSIQFGRRGYRYPAWQLDLPGIDQILEALRGRDSWDQLSFFLNPSEFLGDRSPIEKLKESTDNLSDVLNAAAAYGEQGG